LNKVLAAVLRYLENKRMVGAIATISSGTITEARLAMTPFILSQVFFAWLTRYSLPIKNLFIRKSVTWICALCGAGSVLAQLIVFRKITGIQGPLFKNDNLSFVIIFIGQLLSLCVVLNSVATVNRTHNNSIQVSSAFARRFLGGRP
jgi:hypothetical protein